MKQVFLLLLLFMFSQSALARSSVQENVDNQVRFLHKNNVSIVVCYYIRCIGNKVFGISDSICKAQEVKYLIWLKANTSFIQRFDECNKYEPMPIAPSFINFVKRTYNKFRGEKLLVPEYKVLVKGKTQIYSTSVDHSCHTIFKIYTGNKTLVKDIDEFGLESKYTYNNHRNIHYLHNQHSLLNKLEQQAEQIVKLAFPKKP
jgi:hypothetical protein